jgi:hypothetical protein
MLKMPNIGYCQRLVLACLMQSQLKFWSVAVDDNEDLILAPKG